MQCAFALRYVSGCLNLVVENALALMDGVWLPVSLYPGLAFTVRSYGWESQGLLGVGSRGGGRLQEECSFLL